MRLIPREYDNLELLLKENKVTIIYGPRQVGKTTLIKNFLEKTKLKYKFTTGDDISANLALSSRSLEKIKEFVSGYDLLVIDEAQRIEDIGLGLKILVDSVPQIKVLITGSASLDLSYKIGEPLVGRQLTYKLYPISQKELLNNHNRFELEQKKDEFLIYGSYPEVINAETKADKEKILKEIVNGYLFKDILEIEKVKGSKVLSNLLAMIALQVGSEVSLTEIGKALELDKKTVARYLNLFEQSFILVNVRGFSRNSRKEITKKSKYFFLDNGIRNAVIENFAPLDRRNDVGSLWENFLIGERLKNQEYKHFGSWWNNYFWRTWDGKEVDWVELRDGKLYGFEFKWGKSRSSISKKAWLETYKNEATYTIVNKDNYMNFVLEEKISCQKTVQLLPQSCT